MPRVIASRPGSRTASPYSCCHNNAVYRSTIVSHISPRHRGGGVNSRRVWGRGNSNNTAGSNTGICASFRTTTTGPSRWTDIHPPLYRVPTHSNAPMSVRTATPLWVHHSGPMATLRRPVALPRARWIASSPRVEYSCEWACGKRRRHRSTRRACPASTATSFSTCVHHWPSSWGARAGLVGCAADASAGGGRSSAVQRALGRDTKAVGVRSITAATAGDKENTCCAAGAGLLVAFLTTARFTRSLKDHFLRATCWGEAPPGPSPRS
mmetsp:Transcript_74455/g.198598  ORF Transcript_74455/g.198598 Transcript_74455/m.198598 type:complete len:267 (-) Transcript_74455:312-1112(-)